MGCIWKPSRIRIHKLSEGAYTLLTDWLLRSTLVALEELGLVLVGVSDDQSPVLAHPDRKTARKTAVIYKRIRIGLSRPLLLLGHELA